MGYLVSAAVTVAALTVFYRKMKGIIMSANQDTINALTAKLNKASAEIVAEVQAIKDAASAGEQLDFSGLETVAQSLDDRTPDAPVEPTDPVDPEVPADGE